jgi:hypothetical protein
MSASDLLSTPDPCGVAAKTDAMGRYQTCGAVLFWLRLRGGLRIETYAICMSVSGSVRLDVREFYHFAPFLYLDPRQRFRTFRQAKLDRADLRARAAKLDARRFCLSVFSHPDGEFELQIRPNEAIDCVKSPLGKSA